jgi:hypothetical protein
MRLLVQDLVDKYNGNHNLFGVCSLALHPCSVVASCLAIILFIHVAIAYPENSPCFRIWLMNSKMLCITNLFLRHVDVVPFIRRVCAIIIRTSLQKLKEPVILTLAWTIYYFRETGQSILCWTHT